MYLAKCAFPFTRVKKEKAARKIVNGIKKNSQRVLIGPEAYAFDILKRVLPVGSDYLNRKLSQMVDMEG